MWFATDNGLARFDGRRVQTFSPAGADTSRILALQTSASGELWIGTEAGAFTYSSDGFRAVVGTENVGVTAILLGRGNYLGTDTGLVLRVVQNESGGRSASQVIDKAIVSPDGSPMRITSLLDDDRKVIAGTPGGGVYVVGDGRAELFSSAPPPALHKFNGPFRGRRTASRY